MQKRPGIAESIIVYCFDFEYPQLWLLYLHLSDAMTNSKKNPAFYERIEDVCRACPDVPAAEAPEGTLTYGELLRRSSGVAQALQEQKREVVGLLFPAGLDYLVSLLGTARSQNAFMPLDPSFPEKRLLRFIEVSGCRTVVSTRSVGEAFPEILNSGVRMVWIEDLEASDDELVREPVKPLDPAYVMFTSGSTGEPKAVLGNQRGLAHFIGWERKEFGLDENPPRSSWLSAITFDVSLRDILIPLSTGGTLCVPSPDERQVPHLLARWLREKRVSFMHCVPTVLRLLTQALDEPLPDMRTTLSAGEPLFARDVNLYRERASAHPAQIEMVNLYGPTETTLAKFFWRMPAGEPLPQAPGQMLPVGHPLPGTAALILDGAMLCPPGEVGEIYIRTRYRTSGYLNRPELTKKVFVQNPLTDDPDDIIYRSGDLGKYIDDEGTVECLGRRDGQVKISGVRIELGEVETDLREIQGVEDAAVVAHVDGSGQKFLVGYVTLTESSESLLGPREDVPERLREELAKVLAPQSVPSIILVVDDLPRTTSGKVNKRMLPKPDELLGEEAACVPPATRTEERIYALWRELFERDRISVETPFAQLGGDSLHAIKALSLLYREFNANLSLREFFHAKTVRELAKILDDRGFGSAEGAKTDADEGALEPAQKAAGESAPLTSVQKGIWMAEQMAEGGDAYALPEAYELDADIDFEKLALAFQEVQKRHDALRTVFAASPEGEVRQQVSRLPLAVFENLGDLSPEEAQAAIAANRRHAFDLEHGPLVRLAGGKIRAAEGACRTLILFNIHHIVCDVTSLAVVADELGTIYGSLLRGEEPLSRLTAAPALSFAAYAEEEAQRRERPEFASRLKEAAKEIGRIDKRAALPADFHDADVRTFAGDTVRREISPEVYKRLKRTAGKAGASMYSLFLSLVNVLLMRKSGVTKVVTGAPVLGRSRPGLENAVGCFVNVAPVVCEAGPDAGFEALLKTADSAVKRALERQDLPIDLIEEAAGASHAPGESPFFDVLVAAVSSNVAVPQLGGIPMKDAEPEALWHEARYDLVFHFTERKDSAALDLNFAADRFSRAHMERAADAIIAEAEAVARMSPTELKGTVSSPRNMPLMSEMDLARLEMLSSGPERPVTFRSIGQSLLRFAIETPDAPAVIHPDQAGAPQSVSYAEAAAKAVAIAAALRAKGVKSGDFVALLADRSPESFEALAAIDLLNAVYVPVDASLPEKRIQSLMDTASPALCLADRSGEAIALPAGLAKVNLSQIELSSAENSALPECPEDSSRTAAILFTSGTTGAPKGSRCPLKGILNTAEAINRELGVEPESRVLQFASPSFDAALLTIAMAWCAGAAAVTAPRDVIESPEVFAAWLRKSGADRAVLPPAYVRELLREAPDGLECLKAFMMGGEVPPAEALKDAVESGVPIFNGYGPSEASVCSASRRLTPEDCAPGADIPIGAPLPNTTVRIADALGGLAGFDEPGEMWISGLGVSAGYVKTPVGNSAFFDDSQYGMTYRTGDLGIRRDDGTILYRGRMDDQVKVAGNRIEPAEVTAVLQACPLIDEAVVLPVTMLGSTRLAAWVVPKAGMKSFVRDDALRDWCTERLPSYAVPSLFVVLEKFLRTPNGKVDGAALKALLEREAPAGESGSSGSPSGLEGELLELWRNMLRRPNLSLDDNLMSAGADSIIAIRAVQAMARKGLKAAVRDIFRARTVRALAKTVAVSSKTMEGASASEDVVLSPAARRFPGIRR